MNVKEQFLKYIAIDTHSIREADTIPSNFREFDLAHLLAYELRSMGISECFVSNTGALYVEIPATCGYEEKRAIGFIVHLDTHPDYSAECITPLFHENYNGEDVILGESGKVLRVSEYPSLLEMKGKTLITTDGTTLLGADDKAGITELMCALSRLKKEEIPHGHISACFMPDEEIGNELECFDKRLFRADMAYTLDGWEIGEVVNESFCAATVKVSIRGRNVHLGKAKGILVNSQQIAIEFHQSIPAEETPEMTEGREGFYNLRSINGSVENTTLIYEIRDFFREKLDERIAFLEQLARELNEKQHQDVISVDVEYGYSNMKSLVDQHPELIENVLRASEHLGIQSKLNYIRGGTSGAEFCSLNLPCPNLGIGGHAYHSPFEHITLEDMELGRDLLVEIIREYAL